MDIKHYIEITGIDLKKFVKKVYELSTPQGLGLLHFQEGELDDETTEKIINGQEIDYPSSHTSSRTPIRMDYVRGRCCKMTVFKENGKLYIFNKWYDHTDTQLKELLKHCNIVN